MDAYYVIRSVYMCLSISSFLAKEPHTNIMTKTKTFLFEKHRLFYVRKLLLIFFLCFCLLFLRFFLLVCSKENKELDISKLKSLALQEYGGRKGGGGLLKPPELPPPQPFSDTVPENSSWTNFCSFFCRFLAISKMS